MKLHRVLLLSALCGTFSTIAFAGQPANQLVFTNSTTYTVPAGITFIEVEVRGGGGGGGGNNGQGGCGGGYGRGVLNVVAGQVFTVTIGAGGAGGSGNNNGSAGGTSSFGSFSATGGGGGAYNAGFPPGGPACTAGGTSTMQLNMTGFMGTLPTLNGSGLQRNPGGASGDGSSRGAGGYGHSAIGGPGTAGIVIVRY